MGQEKRGRHGARRARFSGAAEGAVQNPAEASLAWGDSRGGQGLRCLLLDPGGQRPAAGPRRGREGELFSLNPGQRLQVLNLQQVCKGSRLGDSDNGLLTSVRSPDPR